MVLASVNKQFLFFNLGPIPDRFHVFFRLAVMLFYIFLLWKLHFSKNYREFVTKNQNIYPFSIRWINFYKNTITLFGISATLRQITLFYFLDEKNLFFDYLIPLISIVSSDVLIVYAIINPIILFGLPHFQLIFNSQIQQKNVTKIGLDNKNLVQGTNQLNALSDDNEVDLIPLINSSTEIKTIVSKEKSSNTNTEDDFVGENDKIELLIQRMNEYIKEHQPYREVEFNIQILSKAIQVPQHHIIYIFKIVLKKSFVDFRNELRINYVIDAIKSGKLKNLTMEAISSEAGFASRTTFYAVFKKHIGITPGQYLNELGIEN
jgi:AraC-like DNA-binding protein